MNEKFLSYLWLQFLQLNREYQTTNGDSLLILDKGILNRDSGPDFFNVRVLINETEWAGNMEIHTKSSLWNKHRHEQDSAYDNVILHVVAEADEEVSTSKGRLLPTLVLIEAPLLFEQYNKTFCRKKFIQCESHIHKVSSFQKLFWLEKIAIERAEEKYQTVLNKLDYNQNSWNETCFQLFSRYFGTKVNAEPFEYLARKLPLKILSKHQNSLFQLEALLFGQAGFLSEEIEDVYYQKLQKEFAFLQKKYTLEPMDKAQWKFLRLRPPNFPSVRIAQLAKVVHHSHALFSKVIEASSVNDLRKLVRGTTSEYWDTHYRFGKISKKQPKKIGATIQNILLINVFAPILFAYGKHTDSEDLQTKAFEFLRALPAEDNAIISSWKNLNVLPDSAFSSQALLQLTEKYCNQSRCLDCELGYAIFREMIATPNN